MAKIKNYSRKILRSISKGYWWILHHTTHRYHIVDCRSKEYEYSYGFQEPSELIMLACWNLLIRFVEKNQAFDVVPEVYNRQDGLYCYNWDYTGLDEQQLRGQEIKALYLWWKHERPKLERHFKDRWEAIEELDTLDQAMLHRLINIRQALWT